MELNWLLGLWIAVASVGSAGLAIAVMLAFPSRRRVPGESLFHAQETGAVFLFDGETLLDANPAARFILAGSTARGGDWPRFITHLAPHFPDFSERLHAIGVEGSFMMTSDPPQAEPLNVVAELRGGILRATLTNPEAERARGGLDPMVIHALNGELAQLRETLSRVPLPIWRERADAEVVWANAAYLDLAVDLLPKDQDLTWPLPRLFGRTASAQGASGQRQKVALPDGRVLWFELIVQGEGEGRLLFALPADAAVRSETALQDFLQTLTKTFAHLPTGLAIFDRGRHLQVFNPAFVDLAGLPADMLSMRPSLLAVLDGMRDRNMLPEPKDYRSWRRQLVEMERAASAGLYDETWSLPGGQTYRVIGRPHPNGALALMIEDISNEMLRTRRFRADLELGQAVVDTLDEAIAVFSQSGRLVITNAAYRDLWGHAPDTDLGDAGIASLCDHWRGRTAPSPVWREVEDYAGTFGDRVAWAAEARMSDGRLLDCRFVPLAGGATLVAFRVAPPEAAHAIPAAPPPKAATRRRSA